MKSEKPIDLNKQLLELLEKEQMLAYFDFSMRVGGVPAPLHGICKISKPKANQAKGAYFAVLFIIDTPDMDARRKVASHMNDVNWERLKAASPAVNSVFPVPYMHISAEIYFLEVDIYFASQNMPQKTFLSEVVAPEIERITGFKPGEIIFWDGGEGEGESGGGGATLTARLKRFLHG